MQANAKVAGKRVQAIVESERQGDRLLLRAAVMDAAAALGAWAAELDRECPEGRAIVDGRLVAPVVAA